LQESVSIVPGFISFRNKGLQNFWMKKVKVLKNRERLVRLWPQDFLAGVFLLFVIVQWIWRTMLLDIVNYVAGVTAYLSELKDVYKSSLSLPMVGIFQ